MSKYTFTHKDKPYLIDAQPSHGNYSVSNCGMMGISSVNMYFRITENSPERRDVTGTYLANEVQAAWLKTVKYEDILGLAFVDRYKEEGKQIVINDSISSNKDNQTNKLMRWLLNNAEKHGGIVWAGPVTSNPNYSKYSHLIQTIIWIPKGELVEVKKSMKTKDKWFFRPTLKQIAQGCLKASAYVS